MWIYALTIFLSAFLLFQVQPLIAKIILPWFGGSAAVWTTCMMFFQVALLLGYLYAHGIRKYLPTRIQVYLHLALLLLSAAFLPILPHESWKPTGYADPVGRIVLLLTVTVGLPYFLLSTTSPLLQAWFVADPGRSEKEFPYRLYALSNAGSLLALLSYPFLFEPAFTVKQQSFLWSAGYGAFILLCGAIAWKALLGGTPAAVPQESVYEEAVPSPGWKLYALWLLLSACSCILFLSFTNRLTQDVAPVPFLWILPLSLYLLSFILCFGVRQWEWRWYTLIIPPLAFGALALSFSAEFKETALQMLVPQLVICMFVLCLICHGELARTKPHPNYLTNFYLMISIGGALGGLFVGYVAPQIFNDFHELSLGIGLCAFITLVRLYWNPRRGWLYPTWIISGALSATLLVFLYNQSLDFNRGMRVAARSFYGVLRVGDTWEDKTYTRRRSLWNGMIRHGIQFLDPPEMKNFPTTYYGPLSGIGLVLNDKVPPRRVGLVGLGIGTLAAYGGPGDVYRFYEINPVVVLVARSQFSYLKDSAARVEIVPGDARLSMEHEPKQAYDVLAIDAFSGDSIPVHLLTKEAFAVYFRHLKKGGILAIHITNSYLNLAPIVKRAAMEYGKTAAVIRSPEKENGAIYLADWVLVTDQPGFFDRPDVKPVARDIPVPANFRLWTDDYSNLLQIIRPLNE